MKDINIVYSKEDIASFKKWLELDLSALTWQGCFEKEFEEFWNLFFIENISFAEFIKRFQYAEHSVSLGPILSWFQWLKNKLVVYTFVTKNVSVFALAQEAKIDPSDIAYLLRNFFIDRYPQYDEYLSDIFQVGNLMSENLSITFEKMKERIHLNDLSDISIKNDVMPTMEITLYKEWQQFLKKMRRDIYHQDFNLVNVRPDKYLKKYLLIAVEVLALLLFCVGVTYLVKKTNTIYEEYLADKISIYEPQFLWSDKTLEFKEKENVVLDEGLKIDLSDISDIVEKNREIDPDIKDDTVFGTETDVLLTSFDEIPRDFEKATSTQSDFEEASKGGYQEGTTGNFVYRVMMNSVDIVKAKEKLSVILSKYRATPVDKVAPGTLIPGGLYYNLYVPKNFSKDFLSQVMSVDKAILFTHRAKSKIPDGKNKVFIWIKSL